MTGDHLQGSKDAEKMGTCERAAAAADSRETGAGGWCWRASSKKSRAKTIGLLHHDMAMQTSRVHVGRQLLRARARVGCEPVRAFSVSAPRGVKEPPPPPPPPKNTQDGTTHFGFETIAEALKEQRGGH